MKVPGFTAEASLGSPRLYRGAWSPTPVTTNVLPASSCFPGFNWCGPGCSGPGDPTNNVDICCKAHDECYDARGWGACSCDRELLGCIWSKINFWTYEGHVALTMWSYFSLGWCNPFA